MALDKHLRGSTYLAGHALTLADVILCCDLKPAFEKVMAPTLLAWASMLRSFCRDAYLACMHASMACDSNAARSQVIDPATREAIPCAVRWFHTLAHQQHFAAVLGPVSLADAAHEPAGSGKQQRGSGGGEAASGGAGKAPGGAGKAPKEKKPAKPKQAPTAAVANGGAAPGARTLA